MWLYGAYKLVILVSAFVVSAITTGVAYAVLKRAKVLDMPNDRSNHSVPTPRGGGLGIVFALAAFLVIVGEPWPLVMAILVLAAVSFVDDIQSQPARLRFLAQAVMVVGILATVYPHDVFPWLPQWVELPLLALAWLWFINLFNFMDGSDGLAASEALAVGAGVLLLYLFVPLPFAAKHGTLVMVGAVSGFLLWNWPPAKIFMGDVGSVPLGFMLGYLLLEVAGMGHWAAALILPAVFVADASFTLLRRLKNRERVFEAHSTHCYQRAIRGGMSHRRVVREVMEMNLLLMALAALSTTTGWQWQVGALLVAYGAVFWLLSGFARYKTPATDAASDVTEAEVVGEIPPPVSKQ